LRAASPSKQQERADGFIQVYLVVQAASSRDDRPPHAQASSLTHESGASPSVWDANGLCLFEAVITAWERRTAFFIPVNNEGEVR